MKRIINSFWRIIIFLGMCYNIPKTYALLRFDIFDLKNAVSRITYT